MSIQLPPNYAIYSYLCSIKREINMRLMIEYLAQLPLLFFEKGKPICIHIRYEGQDYFVPLYRLVVGNLVQVVSITYQIINDSESGVITWQSEINLQG